MPWSVLDFAPEWMCKSLPTANSVLECFQAVPLPRKLYDIPATTAQNNVFIIPQMWYALLMDIFY